MPARDSVGEWIGIAAGAVAYSAVAVFVAAHTKSTAPILTFSGVVLVALITAFTATRARQGESERQRVALDAETTRQRVAVEAERVRLRLQLAHEREMADLQHVRSLLDDAAVALHKADAASIEVRALRESRGAPVEEEAARPENVRAMGVATDLDRLSERLAVRLGPQHDAVEAFRAAAGALWATLQAVNRAKDSDSAELQEALGTLVAGFHDARGSFLAAAAKAAGVRIPPDDSDAATVA